ncbi:Mo-dependent nitrogenase C-terminal domain-containing protein [Planktothrix agardhii]|jgi:hypothetical protein|nr:Mo-dependent nitrogenase C-terminal domain-containing protein [Planktothrix agardhii]
MKTINKVNATMSHLTFLIRGITGVESSPASQSSPFHPQRRFTPLRPVRHWYEELVYLRFQALCYLADECGEDISAYC